MKLHFVVALILLKLTLPAFAALGEDRGVVESEKSKLNVAKGIQTTDTDDYSMLTMQSPTVTVNQYANAQGQIFAVTWRGLSHPDLSVLLGSHFNDFQAIRQTMKRVPGRRPVVVKTGKIIVRQFGHMRDLRGIAYQAELVPAGVNPETLP